MLFKMTAKTQIYAINIIFKHLFVKPANEIPKKEYPL